jgi:hypothetical protein
MTKYKSFEEYLKDEVCDYEGCLDDDMEDYFDNWLGEQDQEALITYADEWGQLKAKYAYAQGYADGLKTNNK